MSSPTSEEELALSIQRSRKRHLPVGLLRGEQVHDRLRAQEASASPDLKKLKTCNSAKMSLGKDEFFEYMESKIVGRLDSVDEGLADVRTTVSRINKAVKHNTTKLQAHEQQIAETKSSLTEIKDEIRKLKSNPIQHVEHERPTDLHEASRNLDPRYDRARRSLRLWPIRGATTAELWASTGAFIGNTLGFGNAVGQDLIETVERAEIPSGQGVKDEVLVRFRSTDTRDSIIGASSKLSSHVDPDGRPTAGIRLEIPANLRGIFRTLRRYGNQVRARHGPGTRSHIKFNDEDRTLFLNVRLPGDSSWSRIDTTFARRGLTVKDGEDARQLEARLDINGPLAPRPNRPRAASVASTNSSSVHTDIWTAPRERAESMDL